ncbi:MAG: hypothetical protein KJO04_05290 [Bacteroidia bacterium]|nr:hypothetical protein [Bacteroidia bacterium]
MTAIHPKIFVDEKGTPKEVLISWEEYQGLVETLGLDLDEESQKDLIEAKKDLEAGSWDAFVDIDEL